MKKAIDFGTTTRSTTKHTGLLGAKIRSIVQILPPIGIQIVARDRRLGDLTDPEAGMNTGRINATRGVDTGEGLCTAMIFVLAWKMIVIARVT